MDDALEEASLGFPGLRLEVGVHLFEGRRDPALRVEFLRFAQVVGGRGERGAGRAEHDDRGEEGQSQGTREHRAIIC